MGKLLVFNLENLGKVSSCAYISIFNQNHIWRTLNNIEVFLITEGTLYIEQGDFKKPIHKGEVFISKNNIPYGSYKKSKVKFYFMHIEQPNIFEINEDQASMFYQNDNFLVFPQSFKLLNAGHVIALFNELVGTFAFPNFNKTRAQLLKTLLAEMHYSKDNFGDISMNKNPLISRIIEYYIYSPNANELHSAEALAKYFYYNKQYLARTFKKETGMDLSEFLINVKLRKAKENLVNTNKSIKTIATELGYRQDYFQKLFKNRIGLTPVEFRKANSTSTTRYMIDVDNLFNTKK